LVFKVPPSKQLIGRNEKCEKRITAQKKIWVGRMIEENLIDKNLIDCPKALKSQMKIKFNKANFIKKVEISK
jgi:hypothetical protein